MATKTRSMSEPTFLIQLAIAQFTGFSIALKGGGRREIELVESMGLTKAEWRKVRKEIRGWFPRVEFKEIDEYFLKEYKP